MEKKYRKYLFLLFALIDCSFMCSQEQMEKKEYYQGVNNTYEIKYVNNSVFVSNVINPFEGLTNEAEWREVFKAQAKGDSTDILNTYLKPYLKDIDLTDSEFDLFLIFLDFDLSGKLRYIIFAYPEKINIPFEVFETLDTKMRQNCSLVLTKRSPTSSDKGISYIRLIGNYHLQRIKNSLDIK